MNINYERIAKAQFYYKAIGYMNIETPWAVSAQAIRATMPLPTPLVESSFGFLVSSGEQSFIQLMLEGNLVPGKYQTTTPCFQVGSPLHPPDRQTALKTELVWYAPDDPRTAYEQVLNAALACFFSISDAGAFDATPTPQGFDICYDEVPVGSYGVRRLNEHVWVYGTGINEPKFSDAIRRVPESEKPTIDNEKVAEISQP